ncbi:MAG: hypothetical protein IPP98_16330 [Gemmatimonadetes bacterium]|nr:hypothetical protein [Gemmatimonadota bacterium]
MIARHPMVVPALALAVLASCSDTGTGPSPDQFILSTDQPSYTAGYIGGSGARRQYSFTLVARFTNNAESTVYLSRCTPDSPHPIFGVSTVAGTEDAAYNGPWGCAGHNRHIAVRAGQTRIDTLLLTGPLGFSGGLPLGTLSGPMRLAYEVQSCQGDGVCPIVGAGASNVFTVAVQP